MSLEDREYAVTQIGEIIGVSWSTVHRALAEGLRNCRPPTLRGGSPLVHEGVSSPAAGLPLQQRQALGADRGIPSPFPGAPKVSSGSPVHIRDSQSSRSVLPPWARGLAAI
jgi:hypothetical protein